VHTLYPSANISRVGTVTNPLREAYACAAWIDALDPLFGTIADKVHDWHLALPPRAVLSCTHVVCM
jgi:hypothetical protein